MAVSNLQRNLSIVLAALAEETELKKCPTARGCTAFWPPTALWHQCTCKQMCCYISAGSQRCSRS